MSTIQDPPSTGTKVVTAMSGGVDSSVAALLLHREGYDVTGVSMQVWDYRNHGGCKSRATCCAPDDFTDARKVAGSIGIPYYVFDFEKTFRHEVIDRFVATYQRGETPNPCIDCNSRVKFRELRHRSEALGIPNVATGHYARIERDDAGYHLLRGSDREKDQSYFLYGLSQEELSHTLFPVGAMSKAEVREVAAAAGLVTASKPESQDICFVSGSAGEFVARIGGRAPQGVIINKRGEYLGVHDGIQNYTVGQRRGLGIGGSENPLYVVEIDAENNRVVVGERSDLERESFLVREVTWVAPAGRASTEASFECTVQVRHRHAGVPARVELLPDATARVSFLRDWATVSPGQAAVFYDTANVELLGGGRIVGTARAPSPEAPLV